MLKIINYVKITLILLKTLNMVSDISQIKKMREFSARIEELKLSRDVMEARRKFAEGVEETIWDSYMD